MDLKYPVLTIVASRNQRFLRHFYKLLQPIFADEFEHLEKSEQKKNMLKNPKILNLGLQRQPHHKGLYLDIIDISMDSLLITNYIEHLMELYPTIRVILIENLDIFFRASDKYYAKSFYKKTYSGKETDYKNVCQMINTLQGVCIRNNARLIIGMNKIDIIPIYVPLPRGFEFGKEVKVVDPSTDDLTSNVKVIETVLNPADELLNL